MYSLQPICLTLPVVSVDYVEPASPEDDSAQVSKVVGLNRLEDHEIDSSIAFALVSEISIDVSSLIESKKKPSPGLGEELHRRGYWSPLD